MAGLGGAGRGRGPGSRAAAAAATSGDGSVAPPCWVAQRDEERLEREREISDCN